MTKILTQSDSESGLMPRHIINTMIYLRDEVTRCTLIMLHPVEHCHRIAVIQRGSTLMTQISLFRTFNQKIKVSLFRTLYPRKQCYQDAEPFF